MFEHLMKLYLMTKLVLNNQALESSHMIHDYLSDQ